MKALKNTVAIALALSATGLTACSDSLKAKQSDLAAASLNLDPGAVNQAPKIQCQVSSSAGTRTLNTDSELDTFFASNPKAGETLAFNCSGTRDEAGVAAVQFYVDAAYNPAAPNFQPLTSANFSLPVATAGLFPMAIKAVDSDGAERVKSFSVAVSCAEEIRPVLDLAGVSVTANGKLNFFDYAVSAGALSGGTKFNLSWDFNGDGVFDPYSVETENDTWTDKLALTKIYTIFASTAAKTRKIGLKVRNECMYEAAYQIPVVQEIPNIERTPSALAVEKPYYYLQADIHGTPVTNQRVNGDYIATQYPDELVKRVRCDYKFDHLGVPAVFSIKGLNWYKGGSSINDSNAFLHGMEVRIQGIKDQGTMGLQSFTVADGLVLSTATYKVSAADDGVVAENYGRTTACDVTFRVKRAVAVSPCAANETMGAGFVDTSLVITGEFDCPELKDASTGKTVSANNGKFFCEVSTNNQCVGGGGGGGGGKPPPQQ